MRPTKKKFNLKIIKPQYHTSAAFCGFFISFFALILFQYSKSIDNQLLSNISFLGILSGLLLASMITDSAGKFIVDAAKHDAAKVVWVGLVIIPASIFFIVAVLNLVLTGVEMNLGDDLDELLLHLALFGTIWAGGVDIITTVWILFSMKDMFSGGRMPGVSSAEEQFRLQLLKSGMIRGSRVKMTLFNEAISENELSKWFLFKSVSSIKLLLIAGLIAEVLVLVVTISGADTLLLGFTATILTVQQLSMIITGD
ncbi:MAG: hypothetical protein CMB56_005765 [Methanobacteriota archaeon]|nr:MAG: hypothetical protein CMB56_005765 [Euryarchaeota archaeon]|tara:strand:+ start:564 stop:1328 length:765 start_codon:yes stop_codon:yes gene_type:complete